MSGAVDTIANARQATDQDLATRAGLEDHVAFATLVESRHDRAFRTASAILGSEADARAVVRDAGLWRRP
jgi:hypothetical protein